MGSVWTETCIEPEDPPDGDRKATGHTGRKRTASTSLYSEADDADASDDEKVVEPTQDESVRLLRQELESAKNELQSIQVQFAKMNVDENPEDETTKLSQQLQQSSERYNELVASQKALNDEHQRQIAEFGDKFSSLQQQLDAALKAQSTEPRNDAQYESLSAAMKEQNSTLSSIIEEYKALHRSQLEALQRDSNSMKMENQKLSDLVATVSSENDSLKKQVAANESVAKELEIAKQALLMVQSRFQRMKEEADLKNTALTEQYRVEQEENTKLNTKLQESTARYDAVLSAQKEADEQYEKQIADNKATSEQLQQQLESVLDSKGNEEEKQKEYQALCESLQSQNANLNQRMEEHRQFQISQMKALQREKEEINAAATSLGEENQNLMERLAEMGAQTEALKKRVDEQEEMDRVKQEERQRMEVQLQKSSAKYLESENYHNLIQKQYEREIDEYKSQSEALQQQLVEAEAMDEEDLNEYKSIIAALQEQNTKLEAKMGSIRKAQKSQMESLQNEKEDLKAMTMSLSEEKSTFALQMEERSRQIEGLKAKIEEYVAAEEGVRRELAEKSSKLQESSERYNAMVETQRSQNQQYEQDIAEYKTNAQSLQQQIQEIMEQNNKSNSKSVLGALKQKFAENERLSAKMQEYAESQQSQMDALVQEKEAIQNAAEAMAEDNKSLSATVARLTAENEKLKETQQELPDKFPEMANEQSKERAGVNILKEQIDALQLKLDGYDQQIAPLESPKSKRVRFEPTLDAVDEDNGDPLDDIIKQSTSTQLQDIIQQSTSVSSVHAMKKIVMNKYSTVAFGDELDDNDVELRSPMSITEEVTAEDDDDEDSSVDEEEREEIKRLKTLQDLEIQRAEEIEAMQRAMDPDSTSDGEDLPRGIFRAESEQKWNTAQMRKQKKEMQEAMAHLVAGSRPNSTTFNPDDLDGIKMVSVDQPHADEMEDRVNELHQTSISTPAAELKKIVMSKYSTVAYGDDADVDTEDEAVMAGITEEMDVSDQRSDSESLDEAEKAQIAMLKQQAESQKEMAEMEEALKAMDSDEDQAKLIGALRDNRQHHKSQKSGLIKDLDMAELQFTDEQLIQQKKEMQEQMYHLLESGKSATPVAGVQQTPPKMFEPDSGSQALAVVDAAEEDTSKETQDMDASAKETVVCFCGAKLQGKSLFGPLLVPNGTKTSLDLVAISQAKRMPYSPEPVIMGSIKSAMSESCFEPGTAERRARQKRRPSTSPLLGEPNQSLRPVTDASDDEKHKEPIKAESLRSLCDDVQSARDELQQLQSQLGRVGVNGNATDQTAKLAKQLQQSSERYNELVTRMLTAATVMDANNKSLIETVERMEAENERLRTQSPKGNELMPESKKKVTFGDVLDEDGQNLETQSSMRLQALIEQSASLKATELKQLVMKKYSTVAYGLDTDDDGDSAVQESHEYHDEETDNSESEQMDEEELEEIQRLKQKQTLEMTEREELEAMMRALGSGSGSGSDAETDEHAALSGPLSEESAREMTEEQIKRQKKEMQEAMAHLVHSQSMGSGILNNISIPMITADTPVGGNRRSSDLNLSPISPITMGTPLVDAQATVPRFD